MSLEENDTSNKTGNNPEDTSQQENKDLIELKFQANRLVQSIEKWLNNDSSEDVRLAFLLANSLELQLMKIARKLPNAFNEKDRLRRLLEAFLGQQGHGWLPGLDEVARLRRTRTKNRSLIVEASFSDFTLYMPTAERLPSEIVCYLKMQLFQREDLGNRPMCAEFYECAIQAFNDLKFEFQRADNFRMVLTKVISAYLRAYISEAAKLEHDAVCQSRDLCNGLAYRELLALFDAAFLSQEPSNDAIKDARAMTEHLHCDLANWIFERAANVLVLDVLAPNRLLTLFREEHIAIGADSESVRRIVNDVRNEFFTEYESNDYPKDVEKLRAWYKLALRKMGLPLNVTRSIFAAHEKRERRNDLGS